MIQQPPKRAAGIQEAPPVLGILRRQQNLRRMDPVLSQRIAPRMCELHLTRCSRGLQFGKARTPLVQTHHLTSDRNSAGRDHEQVLPVRVKLGDVFGQPLEPRTIELAVLIDEQRGAHLDDKTAQIGG